MLVTREAIACGFKFKFYVRCFSEYVYHVPPFLIGKNYDWYQKCPEKNLGYGF